MSTPETHASLLAAAQQAFCNHPDTAAFAHWPTDLQPQPVVARSQPALPLLTADVDLHSSNYGELQRAILAAGHTVHWRETYKAGQPATEFMARWGCFSLVGNDAPFGSDQLRVFVVYMPPGLYYPPHRHPAEEIYLVIAGQAVFKRSGCANTILTEDHTAYHASNQVHALETTDSPVLCLVAWRTNLDTPPVLVDEGELTDL